MKNSSKIKLLTLGDHPLVPSGVGIQSRYIIEGLLATGRYQVRSIGGALKHDDYRIQRIQEYGDDWVILPINGYGDENIVRAILDEEKPDAVWFVTDPRFYGWLFNMSDEIRDRNIPLLYWHLWDEKPIPMFNKPAYDSCDFIGCISKLTCDIMEGCEHKNYDYIPHSIDYNIFKPLPRDEVKTLKAEILGQKNKNKFVFFYNSRNARRKMTSDVVRFFKEFCDEVGQDKALLFMKCDPHDKEGANLIEVAKMLGLTNEQLYFSNEKLPPEKMAILYNISSCTVGISNNEGFGLSSLESLACGVPVISTRTGGLQDQNIDGDEVFGISLFPTTKSLTGSQEIPYIYDCRVADKDILAAYIKMYNTPEKERLEIGQRASESVKRRFPMNGADGMITKWDNHITRMVKEFRQNGYKNRIRTVKV